MLGDMKDKFCLKDMVKFFIKTQPDVKKFWKKKSKDLTSKYELENINEEQVEPEPQKKLLNKKQNRKNDSEEESNDENEKTPIKINKNKATITKKQANGVGNTNKNIKPAKIEENSEEEPMTNTTFAKNTNSNVNKVSFAQPKSKQIDATNDKGDKTPFKRIDSSLKEILPETLQDNSYDSFMYKTGENYGQQANEKLKFTKGRDFKKEKTKFKNKTAFGGLSISTAVRSIQLDDD